MRFTILCALTIVLLPIVCSAVSSSDPIISSWKKTTGSTQTFSGKSYTTDITGIFYSSSNVYITSQGIPSYTIGPSWTANPNTASGQSWVYSFTQTPTANTGTKFDLTTYLGQIGAWSNGMAIYNGYDGFSYANKNVWHRNAYVWEGVSFDNCWGHPDGNGVYHNHVPVICMTNLTNPNVHSPIIGYAFDGFPIYGPYGYTNKSDATSAIKRITPGYAKRSITTRQSLANGTTLSSTYYGPDVNTTYPLGSYLEDFEYSSSTGDLDACNGRFGVTPEYPNGIYAYFTTVDSSFLPLYPFVIGPCYYGQPTIPNGRLTVPSGVTTYFSNAKNIEPHKIFHLFSILITLLSGKYLI